MRQTGRCVSLGAKGDGVVALTAGGDAFAELTAPGDEGTFDVAGDRARLVELAVAGTARVEPPCPHYGRCGGCQIQHLSESFQRDWKRGRVVEALARAGISDAVVAPTITTPTAARRRAVFTVDKSSGRPIVGFNERRSSRIVAVDGCLVMRADLRDALPALAEFSARTPAAAFDLAATAADNGVDVEVRSRRLRNPSQEDFRAIAAAAEASPFIRVSLNGELVLARAAPVVSFGSVPASPPPGAFLQASVEGEAAIAAEAVAAIGAARRVCDLYSGCGTFALRFAAAGAEVTAIDADGPAIEALGAAARAAHARGAIRTPVAIEARDLDERPFTSAELSRYDAALFDPPRAGAAQQASELARSRTPVVVSVSCNPATFARDAAILVAGGLKLERVTPVDQFTHSAHVECVGVFRRR